MRANETLAALVNWSCNELDQWRRVQQRADLLVDPKIAASELGRALNSLEPLITRLVEHAIALNTSHAILHAALVSSKRTYYDQELTL